MVKRSRQKKNPSAAGRKGTHCCQKGAQSTTFGKSSWGILQKRGTDKGVVAVEERIRKRKTGKMTLNLTPTSLFQLGQNLLTEEVGGLRKILGTMTFQLKGGSRRNGKR